MKKIKPIPEVVHGIRFDSRLEAEAYRLLICVFGRSNISCHESISFAARHACIPTLTHKVDFVIRDSTGIPIRYVEVKGVLSSSFYGKSEYIRNLILMETLRPNVFDKYVVWVGSGTNVIHSKCEPSPFVVSFPKGLDSVKDSLFL